MIVALRILIGWLYVNTGCLVMLGAPGVSPGQEAFWYLAYAAVLWVAVVAVALSCRQRLVARTRRAAPGSDAVDAAAAA